jgi:hypothetical protein
MFLLHRLFAFWAALLAFIVAGAAQAQTGATLKLNQAGVTHTPPRGTNSNRLITQINLADCLNDDVMTFPLAATGFSNLSLQAWVGTADCTVQATRQNTSQTQCWLIESTTVNAQSTSSTGNINLSLHVSSMVSGFTTLFDALCSSSSGGAGSGGSGSVDVTAGSGGLTSAESGGATSSTNIGSGRKIAPDSRFCQQPCSENVQGATSITVYFMLLDGNGVAQASDQWVGKFKLVGPPAPDKVSAGIGGNLLVVNFSYNTPPSDTTGNGFYLYCDPKQGTDAALDAGLIEPDAGSGVATKCTGVPSAILSEKAAVPGDAYRCGTAQMSSQTANATGLVNGVPYNIAVAAFDTFDNIGPLSETACQVPQPITGFFKAYQDAGGRGGGGFCSFSRRREPLALVALLGLASCLVLRRRRAT